MRLEFNCEMSWRKKNKNLVLFEEIEIWSENIPHLNNATNVVSTILN
jgi:hypothetical protein